MKLQEFVLSVKHDLNIIFNRMNLVGKAGKFENLLIFKFELVLKYLTLKGLPCVSDIKI